MIRLLVIDLLKIRPSERGLLLLWKENKNDTKNAKATFAKQYFDTIHRL